ncbi:MAG: hypothetical protein DRJ68_00640 [Thermoprotei archaeon]|nr:MAG: hypothetical protein DRJ68_00640 [Thermoprotei archaeon]
MVKIQRMNSWLHKPPLTLVKIALLALTVAMGLTPMRLEASLILLAFHIALLSSIGVYRLLVEVAKLYALFMAVIVPLSLLGGASISYILGLVAYTAATMISFFTFIATTPTSSIEKLLGRTSLTYSYLMFTSSLNELREVIDAFKARGYTFKLYKPWTVIPVFISFISLTAVRMSLIEDSLKARGVD